MGDARHFGFYDRPWTRLRRGASFEKPPESDAIGQAWPRIHSGTLPQWGENLKKIKIKIKSTVACSSFFFSDGFCSALRAAAKDQLSSNQQHFFFFAISNFDIRNAGMVFKATILTNVWIGWFTHIIIIINFKTIVLYCLSLFSPVSFSSLLLIMMVQSPFQLTWHLFGGFTVPSVWTWRATHRKWDMGGLPGALISGINRIVF